MIGTRFRAAQPIALIVLLATVFVTGCTPYRIEYHRPRPDYYERLGVLRHANGRGDMDTVYQRILESLAIDSV